MTRHRSAFAAAIFLVLGPVSAFAQTQVRFVEYSAKFLCGAVDVQSPAAAAVRPGIYETSINIHNPQLPVTPLPSVTFVKKVVLALPEGEKPTPPSKFRRDVLQADFAEQVNCKIIREMLGPAAGAPFVEGFVVLIVLPGPLGTPHELDVVGVYTVNTPQQSISLEIVPVAPRVLTFPTAAGAKLRDKLMKESQKPEDGAVCGGIQGLPCGEGQFCDRGRGQCKVADAQGVCKTKPTICTREFKPVCGCDGKTYGNACTAAAAGVSIDYEGECQTAKPVACGGIAGLKCPNGQTCVDDPSDTCDPKKGGADCPGICQAMLRDLKR